MTTTIANRETTVLESLPPGVLLIGGALLVPLLPARAAAVWALILPLAGLVHLLGLPLGVSDPLRLFSYDLTPVRVDALSRIFGIIFHLAAALSALYALHVKDKIQHAAALVYAGSAIGAVFAGDLLTLFVYWEITAISSVFLVWAARTERALRAGLRYLVVQVGSGVLLLAGLLFHVQATGSLAFDAFGSLDSPGVPLIFIAFGIKCAFPFLHNWLQDAYPEATVTGTVYLSAFTTKLAVYALARGFPGIDILVPIGVTMTLFPIFYAVIENDLRRVLAYSLNNQLGFMVVGIGIGTAASLNGAVAHAFCHILYKSLLFMSMGAVLYRTGTIKASELGGLYRSMPVTCVCCIVGAMSISAFPLFSGFISKSLIIDAAVEGHLFVPWLLLLVASAGVMEQYGIKIPYRTFFQPGTVEASEAPPHMLAAMVITAALCIGLGVAPGWLYGQLPHEFHPHPYTAAHVLTQLQLLLFAMLAFVVLQKTRTYPHEVPSTNLDFDWVYRKPLPALAVATARGIARFQQAYHAAGRRLLKRGYHVVHTLKGPGGILARTWRISTLVAWSSILLTLYLILYYLRG